MTRDERVTSKDLDGRRWRKKGGLEMRSVLQDWVMWLPLREQGTLLTGIRGCDLTPKTPDSLEDAERALVAFLRWCVMNPADVREVDIPGSFFRSSPPKEWSASAFGHYPQHWYSHLMHCFEVVGYRHPSESTSLQALEIYHKLVINLHLNPEGKMAMVARLSVDRFKNGTVVS